MPIVQKVSEGFARKTSRRGLVGRGAGLLFSALAGAAAGTLTRGSGAIAGPGTACSFPGPPCHCDKCQPNGVCAKPCVILTTYYASGCWVTTPPGQPAVTCCDCDCPDIAFSGNCGCGSDYHNNPVNCP
jgi:hypothetical protein